MSSPGSVRTKFLAQYLPDSEFVPIVLTVKNGYTPMTSNDFIFENIPHDNIIQAIDPLSRFKQQSLHNDNSKNKTSKSQSNILKTLRALFTKLKLRPYPHHSITWFPFATIQGINRLLRDDIKLIYSTYPSLTNHLIGLVLNSVFNITWIVEFRDLFTDEQSYNESGFRKHIDHYLENQILKKATKIVVVSKGMQEDLITKHPLIKDKTFIIYNGYDTQEFEPKNLVENLETHINLHITDKVYWLYSGSFLNGDRDPSIILRAIANLHHTAKINSDNFCFLYAGNDNIFIEDLAANLNVQAYIQPLGFLSRKQLLTLMTKVDRLLTISRNSLKAKSELTTKLFEYIGSGTSILSITNPEFELAHITRQVKGIVVNFHEVSTIEEVILNDIGSLEFKEKDRTNKNSPLQFFSRQEQTKILAEKLRHSIS